jgi:hypothetical protein
MPPMLCLTRPSKCTHDVCCAPLLPPGTCHNLICIPCVCNIHHAVPAIHAPAGMLGPKGAAARAARAGADQGARPTTSASAGSASRDFVAENKVAAAAAPRPLRTPAAGGGSGSGGVSGREGGAGEGYLRKRDYGQVRGGVWCGVWWCVV